MPSVSVVIPTYNRKGLLLEALQSVFAQSFQDVEVIVIDDGSTDQTQQALQPLKERIRSIAKSHAGVASARNYGIRAATGDYVAFLDSDDLWEPGFLATTTDYLSRYSDLALVSTAWRTLPSGHRNPSMRKSLHGNLLSLLVQHRFVRTSAVVVRRKLLDKAGLFNEKLELASDLDMWLRIARLFPIAFLNVPLSWGRKHEGNITKKRLVHLRLQLQVLEANYDPDLVPKKVYDRHCSGLYVALARRHLQIDQIEEARSCLQRALALNPYSFGARRYLLKAFLSRR